MPAIELTIRDISFQVVKATQNTDFPAVHVLDRMN